MTSTGSDGGRAYGGSAILNESEFALVSVAFNSFFPADGGADGGKEDRLVPLSELEYRFDAVEHPRVKEGSMAPSKAKATLAYQFGKCAAEHGGCVTFDEFLTYHDKLVDEAYDERGVTDVEAFIARTIMGLWRLGNDLLLPTAVRPCFPIDKAPEGMYASRLMTLCWSEPDPERPGKFIIKGVKDVVRPCFKRGDLPDEIQGLFAYPEELAGMSVHYVNPQISIQRWLDFVWSYAEGKYCGVPGIVSARVDLDTLPESISQFIVEHHTATKVLDSKFVPTSIAANPLYKRSSDAYGYGVEEECRRIHAWKVRSLKGKQYGLQYHGLQGKYFSKMKGPTPCNAATGINM